MRVLAGFMLLVWRLMAQAPSEAASANLPAQAIGPMDLLAISVYGAPELTRSVRVSDEGAGIAGELRARRILDGHAKGPVAQANGDLTAHKRTPQARWQARRSNLAAGQGLSLG